MLKAVILCGGHGTRLWPSSRRAFPKQFLSLFEEESLLQRTVLRLRDSGAGDLLLVCSEDHRFLVAEQMRQLGEESSTIILEPVARNTAPAIALAAHAALADAPEGEEPILAVFPADHALESGEAFAQCLKEAEAAAREGHLVTLGITPSAPDTGFGYIEVGEPLGGCAVRKVTRFVEKPDLKTAERFLSEGGYLWNAGIFVFCARRYLDALAAFEPEVAAASQAAFEASTRDDSFLRANAEAFSKAKPISIDYAVMERTDRAVVRPLDLNWSDVGSWEAVWRLNGKDDQQNATRGNVLAMESENNLILAEGSLIATLGVRDLVIVESDDAVLVCHRDRSQDVRQLVEELDRKGSQHHQVHKKVQRPWGAFESLDSGPGFQVKRLTVLPGRSLSLQRHRQRAEHWVVVHGTAKVTRGEEELTLQENQSTYIPLGVIHRLENPGPGLLEVVEVQSGDYLGEDDIERFADDYGRN